jgi:hypothetical protein
MADKVDKPKKKAKQKKDEKGVLAALPSTRPERIGGRRAAAASPPAPKATAAPTASKAAAKPATKRSAATKRSTAAKASTSKRPAAAEKTSSPRATAARRKAAAPRTFEPTQAAEAAAGAADERAAGAVPLSETPREERSYPRPRPVSEGAPGIGTAGYRDQPSDESRRPSGVELATTAVKAAGEVAQLGLTIGGHVLKRVVDRIPKP